LHSEVESWNTRKVTNTVSSLIFDNNIGEDGLSAQSMYEKNIDNSNYQNALCPNQKLLHEVMTSHPGVKKIYVSVVRVINNLLMQISMKNTMTTNAKKETPSTPTLLKFMQVECHVSPWMTLNSLNGLAPTNIGIYGTVQISVNHLFFSVRLKRQ
jgi:hypothetical protein